MPQHEAATTVMAAWAHTYSTGTAIALPYRPDHVAVNNAQREDLAQARNLPPRGLIDRDLGQLDAYTNTPPSARAKLVALIRIRYKGAY